MLSAAAIGTRVAARFVVEALAGTGGMGAVYRARDEETGRIIALKVIRARGSAHGAERFARESSLLSELRHPGIVAYLTHGTTADGEPYLAMEWLEGEDLSRRLDRGALSLPESLRLLRHTAEALAVAHGRGVVHRDLKPSNLFLRDGQVERVALLDFGIARRASLSHAITRTGMVMGTPGYMAPEQARGERDITPAADVFSLGCVLFECLTGAPPFVAEQPMAVMAKILFEEPPKPPGRPRPASSARPRSSLLVILRAPRAHAGEHAQDARAGSRPGVKPAESDAANPGCRGSGAPRRWSG